MQTADVVNPKVIFYFYLYFQERFGDCFSLSYSQYFIIMKFDRPVRLTSLEVQTSESSNMTEHFDYFISVIFIFWKFFSHIVKLVTVYDNGVD